MLQNKRKASRCCVLGLFLNLCIAGSRYVSDLGSTNGTYVNGKRLSGTYLRGKKSAIK